jgi:hypothetical protein
MLMERGPVKPESPKRRADLPVGAVGLLSGDSGTGEETWKVLIRHPGESASSAGNLNENDDVVMQAPSLRISPSGRKMEERAALGYPGGERTWTQSR